MTDHDPDPKNSGDQLAAPRDFSRWVRSPLYWALALSAVFLASGWYAQSNWANRDVERLLDSTPAADLGAITVRGPDGDARPLSAYRGRWVLLDFWASWCSYCVLSLPSYDQLQKDHPERLMVLAVNAFESPAEGQAFLDKKGLTLPLMRSDQLVEQLDIQVLPSTLLLDPQGRQVWASIGYVPLLTPALLDRHLAL